MLSIAKPDRFEFAVEAPTRHYWWFAVSLIVGAIFAILAYRMWYAAEPPSWVIVGGAGVGAVVGLFPPAARVWREVLIDTERRTLTLVECRGRQEVVPLDEVESLLAVFSDGREGEIDGESIRPRWLRIEWPRRVEWLHSSIMTDDVYYRLLDACPRAIGVDVDGVARLSPGAPPEQVRRVAATLSWQKWCWWAACVAFVLLIFPSFLQTLDYAIGSHHHARCLAVRARKLRAIADGERPPSMWVPLER